MSPKRVVIVLAVSLLVAGQAGVATAHPQIVQFYGQMQTSSVWSLLPFCPNVGATWSFVSSGDAIVPPGDLGSGRVSGSGTFNGWCSSTQGTGVLSLAGDSVPVTWASVGSIVVLRAVQGAPHVATSLVMSIRPLTDVWFDISGVAAAA